MGNKFFFLLLFLSNICLAGNYPVITSITNEAMGYDDYQYHITQALLDVGPSTDAHVHSRSVVSLGHRHFPVIHL